MENQEWRKYHDDYFWKVKVRGRSSETCRMQKLSISDAPPFGQFCGQLPVTGHVLRLPTEGISQTLGSTLLEVNVAQGRF
jgi:hypothetical protein